MLSSTSAGTLFVVATPIGNLEDITLRALRVLREVQLIAAEDTRRTAHLLARHAIATRVTSLHEHNETRKTPALVSQLTRGDSIALVSDAGTPTVSDPGRSLIAAAVAAGIRVEAVPGPSAILTALAASGMDADTFCFMGFPPIKANARKDWLSAVASATRTVVFFEAPHRIVRTLHDLEPLLGGRELVLGRELTKAHEQLVKGPINALLLSGVKEQGEFTVVVEFGQITTNKPVANAEPESLLTEFGQIANNGQVSRREAIRQLASRHRMPVRDVYKAIERGKKSVD